MNVGKAAMDTMTTTLLLDYSGIYIAFRIVFIAHGIPIDHILNCKYKYVSAEIFNTIIGGFGLVAIARFTAAVSGILLRGKCEMLIILSFMQNISF
ncbi:MAG: YibE/F family protein [Clostridiales bacterium]|nr:YibE/F family protein [Clostridiales bacterium]